MSAGILRICLGILMTATVIDLASADTYMVNPAGTGDFPTIQAAIDAVQDGDVIELTDGVFTGDGNRAISYGGKAITVRSQSGDPDACIIDIEGGGTGFIFTDGEGPSSVLQDVTITNGTGLYFYQGGRGAGSYYRGGGAYCTSSPTFDHCTFLQNITNSGDYGGTGGGVYCSGSAEFTACRFIDNHAPSYGGGAFASFATFTECEFLQNDATRGGAVACQGSSSTFSGCVFESNHAIFGGAIHCASNAAPTLWECLFLANDASGGGAVYCHSSSAPMFSGCTFAENSAGEGGGVKVYNLASPTFDSCTFYGNIASTDGGGFYIEDSPGTTISNTIIARSILGKAIKCRTHSSQPTISCCNIYGNAGGDYADCITAEEGVNGNIALDPLFCGAPDGDFTLRVDSPCAPFSEPNTECDLIGAWPVECDGPTATIPSNWGQIKAAY